MYLVPSPLSSPLFFPQHSPAYFVLSSPPLLQLVWPTGFWYSPAYSQYSSSYFPHITTPPTLSTCIFIHLKRYDFLFDLTECLFITCELKSTWKVLMRMWYHKNSFCYTGRHTERWMHIINSTHTRVKTFFHSAFDMIQYLHIIFTHNCLL